MWNFLLLSSILVVFMLLECGSCQNSLLEDQRDCGIKEVNHMIEGEHQPVWPWMAMVTMTKDDGYEDFCGGSLISRNLVITAASCLFYHNKQEKYEPQRLHVHLGKHHFFQMDSTELAYKVNRTFVYPRYEHFQGHEYMGLILLKGTVEFTAAIRPICLPPRYLYTSIPALIGEPGVVTGWGFPDLRRNAPNELKEIEMTITSSRNCSSDLRSTDVCVGFPSGTGKICPGDQGGPFAVNLDGEKWTLFGIVANVDSFCRVNRNDAVSFFVGVASHLPWLNSMIST